MIPSTPDEIRAALHENSEAEHGQARIAVSEKLVEAAVQSGDRPLAVHALRDLINSYEYGGEGDKILVPFARMLKMWDDDPSAFDRWDTHGLFWYFKWVTGGMISHPNVPRASMDQWLDEMGRRYQVAGHGMQAVHYQRHQVASHVGDMDAAREAFDAWQGAARDEMSDCVACEHGGMGDWHELDGADDLALEAWRPVLAGEVHCQEEPHRVLSKSLLPLLRLGRLNEARAHHLRGYRMARGNPNLRLTVGRHIEFAALTGNEARGLEMLAEHAAWLEPMGESAIDRLAFLEAVALLLRRLDALGHADMRIPTARPGQTARVADLLTDIQEQVAGLGRRFDERNGTSTVSDRSAARLDQLPLVESLVLGAKVSPLRTDASGAPPVRTGGAPAAVEPTEALIAKAEELWTVFHPSARDAWERVAARGAGGEALEPWVRARIAENTAVERHDDLGGAQGRFLEVARLYDELGNAGGALVNRARAVVAAIAWQAAQPAAEAAEAAEAADAADTAGVAEAAEKDMASVVAEATRRHDDGELADRDLLLVLLYHARFALQRRVAGHEDGPDSPLHHRLEQAVEHLTTRASDLESPYFAASAALLRAQTQLTLGDRDAAMASLQEPVDGFVAAGTPWQAAVPLSLLAAVAGSHGRYAEAERHAREGLRLGGTLLAPELTARLAAQVANAIWEQGERDDEVIDYALLAADRFDMASSDNAGAAAQVRGIAAFAFQRSDRPAEAVAILEAAMPDIEQHTGDWDVVRTKRCLSQCLSDLGEHEEAARVVLSAAAVAATWPNQTAHANLAHEAGGALQAAGMAEESQRAYERAAGLWLDLGVVGAHVRATRAAAWMRLRRFEPDRTGALEQMEAALAATAPAIADDGADPDLVLEHQETTYQMAQLWQGWAAEDGHPDDAGERALAAAEEAAAGFARAGDHRRTAKAQLTAAEIELDLLDRIESARARLQALRAAAEKRGDSDLIAQCDDYLSYVGDASN